MELIELVTKELVWNKEKIQVVTENEDGTPQRSRVDRIEFLMYDYEDYEIDWFESGTGVYNGDNISILIFHVSKEE